MHAPQCNCCPSLSTRSADAKAGDGHAEGPKPVEHQNNALHPECVVDSVAVVDVTLAVVDLCQNRAMAALICA